MCGYGREERFEGGNVVRVDEWRQAEEVSEKFWRLFRGMGHGCWTLVWRRPRRFVSEFLQSK